MDNSIKNIKTLAKIINDSQLTAIELTENNMKIRLEKQVNVAFSQNIMPAESPAVIKVEEKPKIEQQLLKDTAVDFNKITEVKSPIIGVFYESMAPDAPPFVKVGSKVKRGDTLCIIEAMKMMNEITSETDGEIVDICAKNGEVVEYSQILFKVF